jgi:hypothetical protein
MTGEKEVRLAKAATAALVVVGVRRELGKFRGGGGRWWKGLNIWELFLGGVKSRAMLGMDDCGGGDPPPEELHESLLWWWLLLFVFGDDKFAAKLDAAVVVIVRTWFSNAARLVVGFNSPSTDSFVSLDVSSFIIISSSDIVLNVPKRGFLDIFFGLLKSSFFKHFLNILPKRRIVPDFCGPNLIWSQICWFASMKTNMLLKNQWICEFPMKLEICLKLL